MPKNISQQRVVTADTNDDEGRSLAQQQQQQVPMVEDDEHDEGGGGAMILSTPPSPSSPGVLEITHNKYIPDQQVVAKDSHGIYEAVVRKTNYDTASGAWQYLVHYNGWSARWDKWLAESNLLESSEETRRSVEMQLQQQQEQDRINTKIKQEKRKANSTDGRKRARVAKGGDASTSNKRPDANTNQSQEEVQLFFEVCCELPLTLKTILVEDRDRMMRRGFDTLHNGYDHNIVMKMKKGTRWHAARDVHQLPASVTIRTVLNHYVKIKRKDAPVDSAVAEEQKARNFVDSLAALFDETLPVWLLYRPERDQHAMIEADSTLKNIRKSELYGCEHLLRFFVRLPVLLAETASSSATTQRVDAATRKDTGKQLTDLIVLLQKNRGACFKTKYREPKYNELEDWEKALRDGTYSSNDSIER